MTPDKLREAVARAISASHFKWERDVEPEVWDVHRHMADAALRVVREALREPSEAMLTAGLSPLWNMSGSEPQGEDATETWRAMLAASALGGPGHE